MTDAQSLARRMATMPVTVMEEVPVPSDEDRTAMLAALRAAERRIAAGDYVEHDAETFVDEMMAVRAAALAAAKG